MREAVFLLVGFTLGITVWEVGHYIAIYTAKRVVRKFMQKLASTEGNNEK